MVECVTMERRELKKRSKPGDGSRLKIGIAVAQFNEDITTGLLNGAREVLHAWKVKDGNVHVAHVYGSFELPFACQRLIKKHKLDAIIALGCLVRGETKHDEYIAHAVFNALQDIALKNDLPIGLGVLTVNTLAQARSRSRADANHGARAAEAALQSVLL